MTYIFNQKNSSASLILDAEDYREALEELEKIVKNTWGWRCENEEGDESF